MGEVIRKNASVEDILADARSTYVAAKARGGVYAELAEQRIAPVLALVEPIRAELAAAKAAAEPLDAALEAADHEADLAVGKAADAVWNAIGRPASDPAYDVLFPGGNAYYVEGDVDEQPERMALLVALLRAGVHPRLDRALAATVATELEAAGTRLRAAVEAARPARAKMALVGRTLTALARTAAVELANYKRALKASGFGEADIHTVIPHRKAAHGKKAEPANPAPSA